MALAFAKVARWIVIFHHREEVGRTLTKSVALELARSGTRVNAVTTGPADTGILNRFTGKPENKAAPVTEVLVGWLCLSEELANPMGFLVSEGLHTSPV
jgi:NAD(P)-dependent dehydrogenase (short-subunit alcohol dehydrogenase family)